MLGFDQHLVAGRNRPSGFSVELEIEERQLERGCWTHGDLESYSRRAETQEAAGPRVEQRPRFATDRLARKLKICLWPTRDYRAICESVNTSPRARAEQLRQPLRVNPNRQAFFPFHVDRSGRIALAPFFFHDTATTEIYPLSLHDALPA